MDRAELEAYRGYKRELRWINERLEEIMSEAYSPRIPHLTGQPGGGSYGSGSRQEAVVDRVAEMAAGYQEKRAALLEKIAAVETAVDSLPQGPERDVLRARYLSGLSLVRWRFIAEGLHYSLRRVYELHDAGIAMLKALPH